MAITVKLNNKNTAGKSYTLTSQTNTVSFANVENGTYQVELNKDGTVTYVENLVVDGAENLIVNGQTNILINEATSMSGKLDKYYTVFVDSTTKIHTITHNRKTLVPIVNCYMDNIEFLPWEVKIINENSLTLDLGSDIPDGKQIRVGVV